MVASVWCIGNSLLGREQEMENRSIISVHSPLSPMTNRNKGTWKASGKTTKANRKQKYRCADTS